MIGAAFCWPENRAHGLESKRKSRIEIRTLVGNPALALEEVIPMLASIGSIDSAQVCAAAWRLRAERARRLGFMLSQRDAAAIEAYAKECEARARQAADRPRVEGLPQLAA